METEQHICPYCGKPVIDDGAGITAPFTAESLVVDEADRAWHLGCLEKYTEEHFTIKEFEDTF